MSQHDDIQQEQELGKVYDSRLMGRLLAYLRPYWRSVIGGLIPILLSAGLQLVPPLAVAAERDPKGLYRKAAAGTLPNLTGVGQDYETPEDPEVVLDGTADPATNAELLARLVLGEAGESAPGPE